MDKVSSKRGGESFGGFERRDEEEEGDEKMGLHAQARADGVARSFFEKKYEVKSQRWPCAR